MISSLIKLGAISIWTHVFLLFSVINLIISAARALWQLKVLSTSFTTGTLLPKKTTSLFSHSPSGKSEGFCRWTKAVRDSTGSRGMFQSILSCFKLFDFVFCVWKRNFEISVSFVLPRAGIFPAQGMRANNTRLLRLRRLPCNQQNPFGRFGATEYYLAARQCGFYH